MSSPGNFLSLGFLFPVAVVLVVVVVAVVLVVVVVVVVLDVTAFFTAV